MKLAFTLFFTVALAASPALLAPVSHQDQKNKGKQVRRRSGVKYQPPPIEEAHKMSAWDLANLRPDKPSREFDDLFNTHPQIKPLHPAQYEAKPQELAEAFSRLRSADKRSAQHRRFTTSVKKFLRDNKASQHVQNTVLGHHKKARKSFVSRGYYDRLKQSIGTEATVKRRQVMYAKEKAKKRRRGEEDDSFSDLLAKHDLPDKMPPADLFEHSKTLLQGVPSRKGSIMLQRHMRDHDYKQSEIDEVQACRTRYCLTQGIDREKEKIRARKASTSASPAQLGPVPPLSRQQTSASGAFHSVPSPPRHPTPPPSSRSPASSASSQHQDDEEWFQSLFN